MGGCAPVFGGLVDVCCFLKTGIRVGCALLYGLLLCVGGMLGVRCRGFYVRIVVASVGVRESRHENVERGMFL